MRNPHTTLKEWREFATSEYGLINGTKFRIQIYFIIEFNCWFVIYIISDDLRRQVWPLLVEVDPKTVDQAPTLDELKSHPEYNQVVLDVNRSLKRFPPGIPYEQRLALQDQLTVLILRVIIKYPHLKYYQVKCHIIYKNFLNIEIKLFLCFRAIMTLQ